MKAHEVGRAIMERQLNERPSEAALRKIEGRPGLLQEEALARTTAIIDDADVFPMHSQDQDLAEAILTELGLWDG